MPSLLVRLLVPYLAVGIFWCWLRNAWLAILVYHALIAVFARSSGFCFEGGMPRASWKWIVPSVLAGPALYFLMPLITEVDVVDWLANYSLSGPWLYLMIPYFGLVHPAIEQSHWAPLCKATPYAHLLFAGYHLLVLATLLSPAWLVVAFVSLASVSWFWQFLRERFESPWPAIVSHSVADFGMIAFLVLG